MPTYPSFIEKYRLKPGDIVLAVNRKPMTKLAQMAGPICEPHGNVALLVQRATTRLFLTGGP
ncbi:hypothetical protein [Paraburkholderia sp. SG-MS1]|uniref:hypothetical protein n=1 Tax=Paraburkholderia sp. SG-MS1 TaxID=2023741 RepID=UPI001445D585|nr:hypothetical protein [Paraburkholderia sp. SG-MS1]